MERDAEANWELKIIKTEVWAVKPLINELVQDLHIKEGKIIEDFRLLLALYQLLKSIITKIVIARQINGYVLFLRTAAEVRTGLEECTGFLFFFSVLEMRERSSDCTLSSGGAVANGFALEIFEEGAGFEAFGFFCFTGFDGAGASSELVSSAEWSTAAP